MIDRPRKHFTCGRCHLLFARRLVLIAAAMGASLGWAALVMAHPGHRHDRNGAASQSSQRTWTSVATGQKWRGVFVAQHDDQIQIRLADDSLIKLPVGDLVDSDQRWIASRQIVIQWINFARDRILIPATDGAAPVKSAPEEPFIVEDDEMQDFIAAQQLPRLLAQFDALNGRSGDRAMPEMAKAFEAFVKTKAIRTHWDDKYFYIESNGIPDHPMMVGITSWQQQVPLPQAYSGLNAWRIPLKPVPARIPSSTKNRFLRGAIALAVNGIPIFNPLNNRGEDSFLFGELDEFGGHCGRADDYHYHLAPVHLEKIVAPGSPIAYALDGYPIYGYEEPDGSQVKGLDAFNGHTDRAGQYHYHATKKYPYLNGGFHGEVAQRGGQVDPQPRAEPIRPELKPLRDARITEFMEIKPGSYRLTYEIRDKKGSVSYTITNSGHVQFTFVDLNGSTTNRTYAPSRIASHAPPSDSPPRHDSGSQDDAKPNPLRPPAVELPRLQVHSAAVNERGYISSEFSCDGASISPPVEWKGAPAGTKSFAISLWHIAPDQEKSYWVVYNIPASTTRLEKNLRSAGKLGINDKRKTAYDPICSKGPGAKKYHITVFALSEEVKLAPEQATRANLLAAIKNITLAEGTLDFLYDRKR